MKKNNKEYWEKRQLAREELSFNKGTEAYKEYVKILSESKKEIENKEEKPMSFSPEEQKMEQTVSDLEKTIDDRKTEEVEEIKDEAKTAIEKD